MQLRDIYRLNGEQLFGPLAKYQDFDKSWFESIVELQHNDRELDEKGLAAAGRFTAVELVTTCSDDGEYSSRVTKLLMDDTPFALHGTGGEYRESAYLLVTDEAVYLAAQEHVRSYLLPAQSKPYDVVRDDQEQSLQSLFGFYFASMADIARNRIMVTYGSEASALLGYEAPERNDEYLFYRMSQIVSYRISEIVSGLPREDRDRFALIGYAGTEPMALYVTYGLQLYKLVEKFEGPELSILTSTFTGVVWYKYCVASVLDEGSQVVRV